MTGDVARPRVVAVIPARYRSSRFPGKPLAEIATKLKLSLGDLEQRLEQSRQKLFDVRERRIHPLKDDKILTDWNGLMIAALAKAAHAFDEPIYAEAATKASGPSKGAGVPVSDKADEMPIEDRYEDDGSIDARVLTIAAGDGAGVHRGLRVP